MDPELQKQVSQNFTEKSDFERLEKFVYAVALVTVFTIITLVIQYFTATQESYQNLTNQVSESNAKVDLLYQATINKNVEVTFPQVTR